MLKKVLLAVSLGVLLATMAVASAGCASSSGLSAMLAKVPSDTVSLRYVNAKALRNDAGLEDLYDVWKTSVDSRLESHGVDHADVSIYVFGTGDGKRFTLLTGKFDMDEVRGELDDRHFEEDEYRGVEVWKKEAGWGYDQDSDVALMGDLIVLGTEEGVEGCIKVMKAGDASWLSKADNNDVASRLPGGLYADLEKAGLISSLFYEGLEVTGISAKKQDSDTLKIAGVAKFEDEGDADDAEDGIEDWMDLQFDRVDITQEGLFLEASAELDIDDAESLFQGLQ
jgi:hypothetical protein